MTIHRLDEARNEAGELTHKMCCICFKMTPVDDLYVDHDNQKWDLCSHNCAVEAGLNERGLWP